MVAHAGQVLDAAAADHHHRVLLQVMTLTRNVADHLEAIGETHLCHLAKRRVRLLRRGGIDARADAALLRRLLQRRNLLARLLYDARTCDQLVDRRHLRLHHHSSGTEIGSAKFIRDTASPRRPPTTHALLRATRSHAKRNRANHPSLDGKRFYATEDRDTTARQMPLGQTEVMHPIRSLKIRLERSTIDLALPSYKRQRLSINGRGWCPSRPREIA